MDGWIDGQSLCRLCLCRSECFIDIFGDNLDLGFNVENTIQELLQFQVTRVEGIPSLACSTCIKELNHFRIFKSRCVDSKVTFERRLSMRQREAEIVGRNEDPVSSIVYGNGVSTAGDSNKDGGYIVNHADEGDNGIPRVKDEEKAIPDEDNGIPLCIVKVESLASNNKLGIFDKGAISSEGSVFGGEGWGVDGGGNGGESGLQGTEEEEQGIPNGVVVKTESLDEDELASCDDNSQIWHNRGTSREPVTPFEKYTKDDMRKALDEVRAGNPIRVVGRAYSIPESTLRRHLFQGQLAREGKDGKRAFSYNQEKKLTGFIQGLRNSGRVSDPEKLRVLAHRYLRRRKMVCLFESTPPPKGVVDWFDRLLEKLSSLERSRSVSKSSRRYPLRKNGYTEGDMLEAVTAVMSGRPIRQVGREMGIAESTLRLRIKKMKSGLVS
ncbi:uncharacterized protein [Hetaerina americana]|uniref:uncharacterized protein n=1 Tax=Hetaerina americana TaxID=62018 RepID=UPI003A7F5CF1